MVSASTWFVSYIGSPPRVWGRSDRVPPHRFAARFTPTCVGTIMEIDSISDGFAVHPHVCGDDFHSAPRCAASGRFTPTCVGTMLAAGRFRFSAAGSPPRVWGRLRPEGITDREAFGSPPRVWGRLISSTTPSVRGSGSPPRVWGRLEAGSQLRARLAVHPHVCGDDLWRGP